MVSRMEPLALPASPLTDGVVMMRLFEAADARRLAEILADPAIQSRNHVAPPGDQPGALAWIQEGLDDLRAGVRCEWAVCDARTGMLAGRRAVKIERGRHRRAGTGSWMAAEARGRRFAPRSARLAASWAFQKWGVQRIAAECDVDNLSSYRALQAAGFAHDGVLRSYAVAADGGRRDQHTFSLLPADLTRPAPWERPAQQAAAG